jgi:hypothetical protein
MSSVHKKLMQARIKLHGMDIKKSGRNDFAKYSYMELGDFLIPTQQIFSDLGLCGVVSFTKDIATLTITDVDDCSQIILTSPMGSAALKGCHEVQQIGAVETYQRRYLWVAAMEIVEHDAIDASEGAIVKGPDVSAILKGISRSTTLPLLKTNFEAAMSMLDADHHPAINKAKNTRYRELQPQKETV